MDIITQKINKLSRITAMQRGQAFEALGLTGTQHAYILNVCREPGITQEQLAKHLYVNKSNVARQVAMLEAAGFITRENAKADRRAICLYPTEKAQNALPEIRRVLADWNLFLLQDFKDDEKAQLQTLLDRVVTRAEQFINEEKPL